MSLWYSDNPQILKRRKLPDIVRLRLRGEESYRDQSLNAFASLLQDQLVKLEEEYI